MLQCLTSVHQTREVHPTIEMVREYLNGEGDQQSAELIRQHVFECDLCADLLAAIRQQQLDLAR